MIVNIDLSQEIFAVDMLRALKSSLKHRRIHVLRPLQLYGDQALSNRTIMHQFSKTLVNSKIYPSELLSVQELTSSVSFANTLCEKDSHKNVELRDQYDSFKFASFAPSDQ